MSLLRKYIEFHSYHLFVLITCTFIRFLVEFKRMKHFVTYISSANRRWWVDSWL